MDYFLSYLHFWKFKSKKKKSFYRIFGEDTSSVRRSLVFSRLKFFNSHWQFFLLTREATLVFFLFSQLLFVLREFDYAIRLLSDTFNPCVYICIWMCEYFCVCMCQFVLVSKLTIVHFDFNLIS